MSCKWQSRHQQKGTSCWLRHTTIISYSNINIMIEQAILAHTSARDWWNTIETHNILFFFSIWLSYECIQLDVIRFSLICLAFYKTSRFFLSCAARLWGSIWNEIKGNTKTCKIALTNPFLSISPRLSIWFESLTSHFPRPFCCRFLFLRRLLVFQPT